MLQLDDPHGESLLQFRFLLLCFLPCLLELILRQWVKYSDAFLIEVAVLERLHNMMVYMSSQVLFHLHILNAAWDNSSLFFIFRATPCWFKFHISQLIVSDLSIKLSICGINGHLSHPSVKAHRSFLFLTSLHHVQVFKANWLIEADRSGFTSNWELLEHSELLTWQLGRGALSSLHWVFTLFVTG